MEMIGIVGDLETAKLEKGRLEEELKTIKDTQKKLVEFIADDFSGRQLNRLREKAPTIAAEAAAKNAAKKK